MEALTGILNTLKINQTIWIQLGCFLISYLALSNLIFKPYYKVFVKRKESTFGGEELAEKTTQEASALKERYEHRAQEINIEFKTIFEQQRSEATKESSHKLAEARKTAQSLSESVRQRINKEVGRAQVELNKEVPAVSAAIASKLIGKEVVQ